MSIGFKIRLVLEQPRVLSAKLKGLKPIYSHHCLTAKDLAGNFKTVIDVGANRGDFSKACRYFFPGARIYAFEPLPKYSEKLKGIADKVFNTALWNKNGKAVFNYNKRADRRSSFLGYGKDNKKFREEDVEKIKVIQKRFDSVKLEIERPCFAKIDVEGVEAEALEGFGNRLKEVDVLQLEVNFQENFKEQSKFSKMIDFIEKTGFLGFLQNNVHYKNGVPERCDLFFYRG
jgi:FkbM family methyltransferase